MSVKFRIGLTIDGETLFGLITKMLPIEDVSVEELPSRVATARAKQGTILEPPRAKLSPAKRASPGPNLERGINGVIITALKEKPTRAGELQSLAVAAGFSANSITSRLESLLRAKAIERVGDGKWRLVK